MAKQTAKEETENEIAVELLALGIFLDFQLFLGFCP